ncbi:MAG: nuclease domain-containing protein [Blastocatellia bacterium]
MVCNHNPETTVACHVRIIGISGIGMKSTQFLVAFGCSACHAVCDGRVKSAYTYEERRLMLLEGMCRTQVWFHEHGYLKC